MRHVATRLCLLLIWSWLYLAPDYLAAQSQEGKKAARLDWHGDPLPPGALARLGSTRFWGEIDLNTHDQPLLTFAADGKTLTAVHANAQIFDAVSGKELRRFENLVRSTEPFPRAIPSPDGRILALKPEPEARTTLWDIGTGKQIRSLGEPGQRPLAFSPDSKTLVMHSRKGFDRWDVATGRKLPSLPEPETAGFVSAVAYSADGKVLAAQHGLGIRVWDTGTRKVLGSIEQAQGSLALGPEGKVLAVATRHAVLLVEVGTDKEPREIHVRADARRQPPFEMALSPDGKFIATGCNSSLDLWSVADGNQIRSVEMDFNHSPWHDLFARGLAFSPDGKVLAAGARDGMLLFWDTATLKGIRKHPGHQVPVGFVAFSEDGRIITTATSSHYSELGDWSFCRWDPATGKEIGRVFPRDQPNGLLSSDGRFQVRFDVLVDTKSGKRAPLRHELFAGATVFSADNKVLASMVRDKEKSTSICHFVEVRTGKERHPPIIIPDDSDELRIAVSPDGQTLAAWNSNPNKPRPLRVWNVGTGKEFHRPPEGNYQDVQFSPDGAVLAVTKDTSDQRYIHLWDIAAGREIRRFEGCAVVALSPDRKLLAAGDGQRLRLCEVATKREICQLKGHRADVRSIVFSPDGKSLVSGSEDTTALVWGLSEAITGRAFHPQEHPPRDLEELWAQLGDTEPAVAHRALWSLIAAPRQAAALLDQRLKPVATVSQAHIDRLLADLESEHFPIRHKATKALEMLNELAEPALRKTLANRPSLELRRRLESLLTTLETPITARERLQPLRALSVLEQIGTTEAKQTLVSLSQGAPHAHLTQEAAAALQRLSKRAELDRP